MLWRAGRSIIIRHAAQFINPKCSSLRDRVCGRLVNAQYFTESRGHGGPCGPLNEVICQLRDFHVSAMHSKLVQVPLAQTGEGIKECELISWHVKEGDHVIEFQQLCEVQSDKASVEITSQYEGTIMRLLHSEGDIVQVGDALLELEGGSAEENAIEVQSSAYSNSRASIDSSPDSSSDLESDEKHPSSRSKQQDALILASPAVRRVAREHNVELAAVTGTGSGGRITQEDIELYVEQSRETSQAQQPAAEPLPHPVMQDSSLDSPFLHRDGEPIVKQIRGYGRAMVRTMTAACAVPHFHLHDDIAMTKLMQLRRDLQTHSKGQKLTMLPFIIKALSRALTDSPDVNATLQSDMKAVIRHRHHNIGVAIATPTGLVVPNIKGVDQLSVSEIAGHLGRLQQLAEEGHLHQEDLAGGTLTVSNIGSIGGKYANALVNIPEVAILALGRVRQLATESPVQRGITMQPVLPMSWGADHRVLDGATLAKCSMALKGLLEHPERLLLDLR